MKKALAVILPAATIIVATSLLTTSQAGTKSSAPSYPVTLYVTQPGFTYTDIPTERNSGWMINVIMVIEDELGIAGEGGDPPFPSQGRTGYVVFDDPDGCMTFFPPSSPKPIGCDINEPLPPPDETYLEFTPDVDQPGVPDGFGNEIIRMTQVDSLGGGPALFNTVDVYNVPDTALLGPYTGEEVIDGYSVGTPDDDLPGLVVLSDTGIGLVLDSDFNPPTKKTQRNLAGLLTSVTYELNDRHGHTEISAHFNMPITAVAPFVKVDDCVGTFDGTLCDQNSQWRIDGGPYEEAPGIGVFGSLYPGLYNSLTYELKFFVVSGTAPGILTDENGNGKIDRGDAAMMGYNVISNERKILVKQFYGEACFNDLPAKVWEDMDGNGVAVIGIVCPAGPGSISKVPR